MSIVTLAIVFLLSQNSMCFLFVHALAMCDLDPLVSTYSALGTASRMAALDISHSLARRTPQGTGGIQSMCAPEDEKAEPTN